MVTTNEGAPSSSDPSSDSGTALSKLRQTLSSSLMTAQDKGKSQLGPVSRLSCKVTCSWRFTAEVRVASPASLCGTWREKWHWGGVFLLGFRVFLVSIVPTAIRTYHTRRLLSPLSFLPRT